jgi:subtilisin family serine protease
MEQTYTVLWDLGRPHTDEPFAGGAAGFEVTARTPSEPVLDRVDMDKREVRDLARDPDVRAIAPVMPTALVRPVSDEDARWAGDDADADDRGDDDRGDDDRSGDAAAQASGPTWGVRAVGADVSSRTGAGAAVAVLDTGIDREHPAFAGVDLVEEDFSADGNGDRQGHGTHCAGTVFGRDVDGVRIGVAPGVTRALIGKVLGDQGGGDSDMLFRGIQWAVQGGAQVISMSLGFDFPGLVERLVRQGWPADLATSRALEAYRANLRMFDTLMDLIRRQEPFTNGTVVVAAAGNESRRRVRPDHEIAVSLPAAAEGVLSTGALGESGAGFVIAPFSNTFPQLAGPGVGVLSAQAGGGLVSLNGTSMATPHVAGVAALWWEDVVASPLPGNATVVAARLLAHADTTSLAPDVDVADRGVGLARAPR